MNEAYAVLKGMIDPVFVLFVLLIVALVIFLRTFKEKSDALILLLCMMFLYAAGIAPTANYLLYNLEKDYIKDTETELKNNIDAIVVLGSGTKEITSMGNTFSNEMGYVRILHAAEYYNRNGARYVICAGKGDGRISEAQILAKSAVALGIPAEKIRIEANSTDTRENAREVHKMLDNKNIVIGLVTSAFHMKRSEREFKKYFGKVIPLPAHYLYSSPEKNVVVRYMPQSEELHKTSIAMKEIIGQWWYKIR